MKKSLIFIITLFTLLTHPILANTTNITVPVENEEEVAVQKDPIKVENEEEIVVQKNPIKNEVLVGFYGRPYTPSLGILGESHIDNVVKKLKEKKSYYDKELGENFDVKLAFHLIYGLATRDPGKDNDYIINLPDRTVMKYIKRAQKEGFAVIIDLQLAVYSPKEALMPVLKYLKYDNVHLALDPEFRIPKHRKYPPGKFIGHIFGNELNEAQELISNYLIENNILEKKKLIIHMFHKRMLRKKALVKNFDNIELIYNIDGHGIGGIKVQIYNNLYSKDESVIADSGFKIFYKNDKKPLMTPRQILGIDAVGSRNIKRQPYYINYH